MISRIRTIIDKEWAEVFKNRMVLMVTLLLPILFTILPLVVLYFTKPTGTSIESTDMPAQFAAMCKVSMSTAECLQVFMINEFMMLYMMIPVMIPITIAAYSIVGEKSTRSLEPLLATPITTEELLAGKGLAAALPAIAATWVCFIIFLLVMPLVGTTVAVRNYIMGPVWMVAIFLGSPLMAILAVNFAVMVSSRVNDPRAAEQISSVLIVPFMLLIFGQVFGIIVLNITVMLVFCLVLALVDAGMIYLGARLFQREAILTRWK